MRIVALVDGEHYPPVVRAVLDEIRAGGVEIACAVFLGGTEKVGAGDLEELFGVGVERGEDREAVLADALVRHRPGAVVDLSDEPVLTDRQRFRLAAVALYHGAVYTGADFELRPPPLHRVLTKPSIRVIATGKRTGKTAVAGALARHAVSRGRHPVVVAMGRGGPEVPEVVEAGTDLTPPALLDLADRGRHAASDYIEDAVTSRVTTIGCRRVGGGLAGAPYSSNVLDGAGIAEARPEDLVVLEGSGSAVPPVAAASGLICIPATADPLTVGLHLNPYRLLLADVAVVTMAEETGAADEIEAAIRTANTSIEVVRAVFRPQPLETVSGRRVFFCTTAPRRVSTVLGRHLEQWHGCEVVGVSHGLSDRRELERDLLGAEAFDVLLTELKAGAVDVAVRTALAGGKDVVFADNALVGEGIEEAFDRLLELADRRSER